MQNSAPIIFVVEDNPVFQTLILKQLEGITPDVQVFSKGEFFLSDVKHKKFRLAKDSEERPIMNRSILHAYRLSINHPTSGERLELEAPLPAACERLLETLPTVRP